METDQEIFSKVIFSLLPIHEGQLSVSAERISTLLVNHLEGSKLLRKSVVRYRQARYDLNSVNGPLNSKSTTYHILVVYLYCFELDVSLTYGHRDWS